MPDKKPKTPRKKKGAKSINWDPIEEEYVCGIEVRGKLKFPTFAELASSHGVSMSTLTKNASRFKWKDKQDKFRQDLRNETKRRLLNELADKSVQFRVDAVEIAECCLQGIREMVKQYKENGLSIDLEEMETMARMGKNFVGMAQMALGEDADGVMGDDDFEATVAKMERERAKPTREVDSFSGGEAPDLYTEEPLDPQRSGA